MLRADLLFVCLLINLCKAIHVKKLFFSFLVLHLMWFPVSPPGISVRHQGQHTGAPYVVHLPSHRNAHLFYDDLLRRAQERYRRRRQFPDNPHGVLVEHHHNDHGRIRRRLPDNARRVRRGHGLFGMRRPLGSPHHSRHIQQLYVVLPTRPVANGHPEDPGRRWGG